jgi:hypothetical protein
MTDDETKAPAPFPPPFGTELSRLRCPHCGFLASARSHAEAAVTLLEHIAAVHPHGSTQ